MSKLKILHTHVVCFPTPAELQRHASKFQMCHIIKAVAASLNMPSPSFERLRKNESLRPHLGSIVKRDHSDGSKHVKRLTAHNIKTPLENRPGVDWIRQDYVEALEMAGELRMAFVNEREPLFLVHTEHRLGPDADQWTQSNVELMGPWDQLEYVFLFFLAVRLV